MDGVKVGLSAYLIDGYNYFKLRDVAAAVGFEVSYNDETTDIDITTGQGNTDDTADTGGIGDTNPL